MGLGTPKKYFFIKIMLPGNLKGDLSLICINVESLSILGHYHVVYLKKMLTDPQKTVAQ